MSEGSVRAVLWDLDGTLADTEELHFVAWREAMAAEGVDYSRADFEKDFGRSNPEVLAELFPEASEAEHLRIADVKEAAFRRVMAGEVRLLPGTQAWLERFREAGLPQLVCSSGPTANIAALVTALDIADFFLGILSGVHVPNGKPAPDLFLRGAAAAGAAPADCLVLEDSGHGIRAAGRAGMRCIAVGAGATAVTAGEGDLLSEFALPERLWAIPSLEAEAWQPHQPFGATDKRADGSHG